MKLDRSKLPQGVSFDQKEGLYAELGPEGQVVHLGIYQDGQRKPDTWALDVAPDGSWARVEGPKGSEARDTSAPDLLEMWVQLWSMWISKGPQAPKLPGTSDLSCSFCGKRQDQVEKLVAGPKVYICNECVGLCNDIIGFEDGSLEGSSPE
jgi:hypothetical protein